MSAKSRPLLAFIAALLVGCGDDGVTDRTKEPVAALNAARAALHRKNLREYFDAVSDEEVRLTLSNSITICLASHTPEMRKLGRPPSEGCQAILAKYGWREPVEREPAALRKAWRESILKIAEPRSMAYELEKNHRVYDVGSSFVWEYLDDVSVVAIEQRGSRAIAKVKWKSEDRTVEFERDPSGWRFTPHPEIRDIQ